MRRETFLATAARLIGETGFEAVTMTSIARRAGASIGTLYDYFPDKEAVALALMERYAEESDEHWKRLLCSQTTIRTTALADIFVDGALTFARERPAYFTLFGAPFVYPRSAAARQPLRKTFAAALRLVNPALSHARALLGAQVVVELIKAMLAVCKQLEVKDRDIVTLEFKRVMRFYLKEVLK